MRIIYYYKFLNSKKSLIDLPLKYLVALILGLASIILILFPIASIAGIFQTSSYNQDVANDMVHAVADFVDFSLSNHNTGSNMCVEHLKITYLPNPQILNPRIDNYVITIIPSRVGLMNFNDFERIRNNEGNLADLTTFNEISFSQPINLGSFRIGSSFQEIGTIDDTVEIIFLVPSIKFESSSRAATALTQFRGDSKAGYHVFYLVREGSNFVIKPGSGYIAEFYDYVFGQRGSFNRDLYSFGFFRDSGPNFGPILRDNNDISILPSCNVQSSNFGLSPGNSDPTINTKGFYCRVIINSNFLEEPLEFRNTIYWDNGYKCASDFNLERNFCNELENDEILKHLILGDRNQNSLQIQESFNRFCSDFYFELFPEPYSISFEENSIDEATEFILNTQLDFFNFFERIPDDDLINYVNSNIDELFFFKRPSTSLPRTCSFSSDQLQIEGDSICNFVIRYLQRTQSGNVVESRIFYIETNNDQTSGFYRVRNLDSFTPFLNEFGNREFRLGHRVIPYSNSQLQELDCGFWRNIGGRIFGWTGLVNGCSSLDVLELTINQLFFDTVVHPQFQVYLPRNLLSNSRTVRSGISESIGTYFTKVDSNNPAGANNEAVLINGEEYILDTRFLRIEIDDFVAGFSLDNRLGNRNLELSSLTVGFKIVNLDLSMRINLFDMQRTMSRNLNNLRFSHSEEIVEYPISFEQTILSMYDTPDLRKAQVRTEIENKDVILVRHIHDLSSGPGDNFYYLRTINTNRPVFKKYINNDGVEVIIPAVWLINNDDFGLDSISGQFVFPVRRVNGDIVFEPIDFEFTPDEIDEIISRSNIE